MMISQESSMGIQELVAVSRRYGSDREFVVAGGGNTSWKNGTDLFVKGSGVSLETIDDAGFVRMDRAKLSAIWSASYPPDSAARESAVLADLMAARLPGEEAKRPSVETLLHDILPYAFIVHTHPALVNGITCSAGGERAARELFGDDVLWIPSMNPGYVLAKSVKDSYAAHQAKTGKKPLFIFLQNHGVFVASDSVEGIDSIYGRVMSAIEKQVSRKADFSAKEPDRACLDSVSAVILALETRLAGTGEKPAAAVFAVDTEIGKLVASRDAFSAVSSPFTPDHIVYAGSDFLFIDSGPSPSHSLLNELERGYSDFVKKYKRTPKLAAIRGLGIFGIGVNGNKKSASLAVDLFRDAAKIAAYAESFGGPRFMTRDQIDFINNWEVESYRSKISTGSEKGGGK
jgi:rhamnose utilization protein RhaD (predicted bifunctional aldolase and dehydrogenase)